MRAPSAPGSPSRASRRRRAIPDAEGSIAEASSIGQRSYVEALPAASARLPIRTPGADGADGCVANGGAAGAGKVVVRRARGRRPGRKETHDEPDERSHQVRRFPPVARDKEAL